jgi:putative membrane protein
MRIHHPLSAVAIAMALSVGVAQAQSQPGAPQAQSSGTGGAGSSMTGGRSAPAAQKGEGTQQREAKKDDKVARGDRKFIEEAAGGGMFEVQVGQLASTRASSPDVKSYAGMLVDQHTKANDELVQLANAKGVELPAAPPRAMRNEIDKLGKKKGADFDKAFIDVAVKDHQKDVKTFEKASKDLKDPELKAWADKTLPTLKEHLAAAQKLKAGGDNAAMGAGKAHDTGNHSGASTKTGGGNGANKSGS